MSVPLEQFGRDHWSTFAYVECRAVDNEGTIAKHHMRCDPLRHPEHAHINWSEDIPTRLLGGVPLPQHDDWDCIEDLEAANLLTVTGTPRSPLVTLTEFGQHVASQLRAFLASGGSYSTFIPEVN